MNQNRTEEKAALLLPEADDDDEQMDLSAMKSTRTAAAAATMLNDDQISIVKKRPRTYHRYSTNSSQAILCVILILFAFISGCVSGVIVMLYRMAQDAEQTPKITTTTTTNFPSTINDYRVDLTIQTNLFQSLNKINSMNFNRSIRFDLNVEKNPFDQWKSMSSDVINVKNLSYPIDLVRISSSNSTNGIELIDAKTEKILSKFDSFIDEKILFLSSLIQSTTFNATSIYYLNYGRHEDFSYLIKNKIFLENAQQSIGFIRRKPSLISVTQQIRHAIYFRFPAVVLFDDEENSSISTTNDREDAFREWARSRNRPIEKILYGISTIENGTTSVLTLSLGDVERIFASLQPDSNVWLSSPSEWHKKSTPIKIGGSLSTIRLRFSSNFEQIKTNFSVNFATIRGKIDPEHFLLVGFPIEVTQQNEIVNEILRSFIEQIQNGWKPKRSIIFSAWSGSQFDHFTLRRWLTENFDSIEGKLIGFIDLGRGVMGNETLNLHGSTLFEPVARRAAQSVKNSVEMGQEKSTEKNDVEQQNHDHHRRRKRNLHENLFDQWKKLSNQSRNLVQMIDVDSAASIFQLEFGFPSILIETSFVKDVNNDTFYGRKLPFDDRNSISTNFYFVYSKFVADFIRQLIDEIALPFNLTIYADEIDRYVDEYFEHFQGPYQVLAYHLGDSKSLKKILGELTKSMRQVQSKIDQIDKNDFVRLSLFHDHLIEFESSLIFSNRTFFIDEHFKNFLLGPAFGLSNTVVPFPALSNLLYNIPFDPSEQFCDAAVVYSTQIRQQIQRMIKRLNSLDELF